MNLSSPATAAPTAPGGLKPSNVSTSGQPVLAWKRVPGAAEYDVELSTDSGFSTVTYADTTTNRRATPTMNLPQVEIFWRVRGVTASGVRGAWGSTSFTGSGIAGPELTSPAEGAALQQPDDPALLSWSPVAKATSYTIEIDNDSEFVQSTLFTSKTTSYLLQDPGPEETYYWRVKGNFTGGYNTLWSEAHSFEIVSLVAPVLRYPDNSADTQLGDAVLDWEPVAGAVEYEVRVSQDDQFNTLVDTKIVKATRYARPITYNNDQYWWQVRAIDVNDNLSPWSSALNAFQRHWPDKPVLLHPAEGLATGRPFYYEWSPIPHASHYELQVGTDPNFSPDTFQTCFTKATTYTAGFQRDECHPDPGNLYYWRVRGLDSPANPVVNGIFSSIGSFSYEPGQVVLLSPSNGATVAVPTMTWSPYGEAQRYKVTLKKASGATAATVVTYSTSWTPTGTTALLPADGPFHWTVQAVDRDNRTTLAPLFGFDRTFSLSGTPPDTAAAPLTPLAPSASGGHEKFPSLKWEPWTSETEADAVRYYKVFVGAASGSAVVEIEDSYAYPAATDEASRFLVPGTYRWFVRAFRANGTLLGTGSESQFTIKNLDPTAGQRLSLTGQGFSQSTKTCLRQLDDPNEICSNLRQTPVLRWDPVPWASYYMVYLSKDRELTNLVYNPVSNDAAQTVNTMWTPRELLADSQAGAAYYWVIRPCKTDGICAPDPTTATNAFDKRSDPVSGLIERQHDSDTVLPANAPTFADEVVFSWTPYLTTNQASTGSDFAGMPATVEAKHYRVQISTDPNFAAGFRYISPLIDQTTFTPYDKLLPEGLLYWRVQALDGSNNSLSWSLSRNIGGGTETIEKRSPQPSLTLPAANSSVAGTPAFAWTPLDYAAKYAIEVYKNNDVTFSTANRVIGTTTEQAAYAAIDKVLPSTGSPYLWRVRRLDQDGNPGAWSTARRFSVKGDAPLQVAPSAGRYVSNRDNYFTWQPVDGAATYRFERRPAGSTRNDESVSTVGLAWAPTEILADGSYEWRTSAYDAGGGLLGSSPWRAFKVDATAPVLVSKSPTGKALRTANFVARFSEPILGVNTTRMALLIKGNVHRLSATVTLSSNGKTATLNPKANLRVGKVYTVRLLTGMTDRALNPLRAQSWTVTAK